jgi:hypothetical protein
VSGSFVERLPRGRPARGRTVMMTLHIRHIRHIR